jgi:hypothetical protein
MLETYLKIFERELGFSVMLIYSEEKQGMGKLCWLGLLGGLLAVDLSAATIQFQVINVGPNQDRYQYFVSGVTLQANQALDIRFDPALDSNLTNGVAGSDFSLVLVQPNNPPGAPGDYRAIALTNNPSLAGPFSVDFTLLGAGTPGSQPFLINQYTSTGLFVSTISSGVTTAFAQTGVPEPATLSLGCMALLLGGIVRTARRR